MSARGLYIALFAMVLVLLVLVVGGYVGTMLWAQRERVAERLRLIRRENEAVAAGAGTFIGGQAVLALIGRFGRVLAKSGILPGSTLDELQLSLNNAGLRGGGGIGLFIGCKVLLLVVGAACGWFAGGHFPQGSMLRIALPLGGAVLGMLLPDMYLKRTRKQHLKRVEAGLPDALDMLVICTEAGLGFEPAMDRVASEIGHAHPAIAEELKITASELRMIADRRQVLMNMGARTGLDSLRRLASTLVQTMQFGTPLSQALRTLATEMRQEALTRFEARAARLPVFLTIPMIVFILPCIFIIVGGPAALQLTSVMGNKELVFDPHASSAHHKKGALDVDAEQGQGRCPYA